jgi:hypothetical protein
VEKQDLEANEHAGGAIPLMALLSTLSTAVDVLHGMKARRTGRDPSTQESDLTARSYLVTLLPALRLTLTRLRISLMYAISEPNQHQPIASAQQFDQVMRLNRLHRTLHVVHQRLLSLYPTVSEPLIETARLLEHEASGILAIEYDGFQPALGDFVERGLQFTHDLEHEL